MLLHNKKHYFKGFSHIKRRIKSIYLHIILWLSTINKVEKYSRISVKIIVYSIWSHSPNVRPLILTIVKVTICYFSDKNESSQPTYSNLTIDFEHTARTAK